ncbi:MAG: response regulator transcription factor [Cytophagales bacterium]|nr:response regulator transcription factor [Cytophagales bacterium]
MIRVIIADDHKLVRDGLKSLLAQVAADMQVVGEAANGREVLALLETTEADVVLMDVDMPELNGIEATRRLAGPFPGVKVLMLTMADNEQWVLESVQAGAQGYLLKSAGRKELLTAIRTVAGGEEYFSTDLTKMLLRKVQASGKALAAPSPAPGVDAPPAKPPVPMSPRELEVLRLIAKGHTNHQIAEMLFTSRRTVETHRQNLLEKTGTNNTATLVLYAASNRLLE